MFFVNDDIAAICNLCGVCPILEDLSQIFICQRCFGTHPPPTSQGWSILNPCHTSPCTSRKSVPPARASAWELHVSWPNPAPTRCPLPSSRQWNQGSSCHPSPARNSVSQQNELPEEIRIASKSLSIKPQVTWGSAGGTFIHKEMFPCVDREPAGPGTQLNIHKGEGTGDVFGMRSYSSQVWCEDMWSKGIWIKISSNFRSTPHFLAIIITSPMAQSWTAQSILVRIFTTVSCPKSPQRNNAWGGQSDQRFHLGATAPHHVTWKRFPGKSHKFQDVPRCSKYGFACLIPVRKLGDNRCGRKPFLIRDLFSLTTCTVEANNMAYSYTPWDFCRDAVPCWRNPRHSLEGLLVGTNQWDHLSHFQDLHSSSQRGQPLPPGSWSCVVVDKNHSAWKKEISLVDLKLMFEFFHQEQPSIHMPQLSAPLLPVSPPPLESWGYSRSRWWNAQSRPSLAEGRQEFLGKDVEGLNLA